MESRAINILGCEVPISTLEAWSKIFVFALEPFFLNSSSRGLLPGTILRREFKPSLEFSDAYLTYLIPKEAEFVVLLEPQDFRLLPREIQAELMAIQKHLGRGQFYNLGFVQNVFGEIPASLESDVFEDHFVLHFDTWNDFPADIQYQWMAAYVSSERQNCLSSQMPENTWAALPEQVRRLAGTFSSTSGANCFATVIAGLTPDLLESTRISNLWMLERGFLAGLKAQGFHDAGQLEFASKPNSVITFLNSSGVNIHACLTLEFGLALNKDAQSWFAPRQILRLQDVLNSWQEDSVEVRVWTRDSV